MALIRICRCVCPHDHTIMGFIYDASDMHPLEVMKALEDIVETCVQDHTIRRRCEMCGSDTTFRYVDAASPYGGLQETERAMKEREEEQKRGRGN